MNFRYRLIGGLAHWTVMTANYLLERIQLDPHGPPNPFIRRPEIYFLVRLTAGRGVMLAESCLRTLRARQHIRHSMAHHIAAHAADFALCDICDSLIPLPMSEKLGVCPSCHGYRFNLRVESIRHAAAHVALQPAAWLTSF